MADQRMETFSENVSIRVVRASSSQAGGSAASNLLVTLPFIGDPSSDFPIVRKSLRHSVGFCDVVFAQQTFRFRPAHEVGAC